MANPINEQITQNVLSAIQSVTTGNGYNYTVSASRADYKRGDSPGDLTVLLREVEEVEHDPSALGLDEWDKFYAIECYILNTDANASTISTKANQVAKDVTKAVLVDPFRNNLAIDTFILPPNRVIPEHGGYYAAVVNISVHYRTLENDPYNQS